MSDSKVKSLTTLLAKVRFEREKDFSCKQATEDAVAGKVLAEKQIIALMWEIESMANVHAQTKQTRDLEV